MEITIDKLKSVFRKKGYTWREDRPNIIGIRTTLYVPDTFNDFIAVVYKIPKMPDNLTDSEKQKWLNTFGFKGKDGKALKVDGVFGPNSQFALNEYNNSIGKEQLKIYLATTVPGIAYQKQLLNVNGCAVVEPGHYPNAYALGYHQNRDGKKINPKTGKPFPVHRALVLVGDITIKRDKDRDGIPGNTGTIMSGRNTGCNIHGTISGSKTEKIGTWSAGCQVIPKWSDKEELMDICEAFKAVTNNRFDYTLILEKDLM